MESASERKAYKFPFDDEKYWALIEKNLKKISYGCNLYEIERILIKFIQENPSTTKSDKEKKIEIAEFEKSLNRQQMDNSAILEMFKKIAKIALKAKEVFKDQIFTIVNVGDSITLNFKQQVSLLALMFYNCLLKQSEKIRYTPGFLNFFEKKQGWMWITAYYTQIQTIFNFFRFYEENEKQIQQKALDFVIHKVGHDDLIEKEKDFLDEFMKNTVKPRKREKEDEGGWQIGYCETMEINNEMVIEDFETQTVFTDREFGDNLFGYERSQQKTITFQYPALYFVKIFCEMDPKDEEAIVAENATRISDLSREENCNARCVPALVDFEVRRKKHIFLDCGRKEPLEQFMVADIKASIYKCMAGFGKVDKDETKREIICTGKWGCGTFAKNPYVRFVVQYVAAIIRGRKIMFCTYGQAMPSLVRFMEYYKGFHVQVLISHMFMYNDFIVEKLKKSPNFELDKDFDYCSSLISKGYPLC